jgi:processive 1,2-diacylglycerol beta-glucosyltransferase
MKARRIAVFSVSAGAGHTRAAEAIKAAAAIAHPDIEVVHIDVMDLVSDLFRQLYAKMYIRLVERLPALWGYLYEKTDQQKADSAARRVQFSIERINTRRFVDKLHELDPDTIICTHFLPAQLLSRMVRKERLSKPVWVQVTDFDIHSLWVLPHITGYFAANEEVAWRMADRGLERDRIRVTGIPIMPVFAEKLARRTCAKELGISPNTPTLLMMSGGVGIGGIDSLAARLVAGDGEFQVVALAGRNEDLLARLRTIAAQHPGRLVPMGFTTTIERVMTASDLAITKPGGLTTSECLAMGLPMIVVSPIPGQEERNADFLLENGAAMKAYDAAGLEYRVRRLLASTHQLAEMSRKARELGRPHAAFDVLRVVLGGD